MERDNIEDRFIMTRNKINEDLEAALIFGGKTKFKFGMIISSTSYPY